MGLADRFARNACLFHFVTLYLNYSIFQHFCLKIYGLHSLLRQDTRFKRLCYMYRRVFFFFKLGKLFFLFDICKKVFCDFSVWHHC